MNIQTVIANLLNTIEGKEQMLANLEIPAIPGPDRMAKTAVAEFLVLNIKELKAILYDCMAVREAEIIRKLEERDIEYYGA